MKTINCIKDRSVVILMPPYFGSRIHIKGIRHVLCPGYEDIPLFDKMVGKNCSGIVPLAKDVLYFLSSHVTDETGLCEVHFAFQWDWMDETAPASDPAPFLRVDCPEYFLSAIAWEPNCVPLPDDARRPTCLRRYPQKSRALWTLKQLKLLGLVELTRSNEARLTDIGRKVVDIVHHTRLSIPSALLLLNGMGLGAEYTPLYVTLAVVAQMGEEGGHILEVAYPRGFYHYLSVEERESHKLLVQAGAPEGAAQMNGDIWCDAQFWLAVRRGEWQPSGQWRSILWGSGAPELAKRVEAYLASKG